MEGQGKKMEKKAKAEMDDQLAKLSKQEEEASKKIPGPQIKNRKSMGGLQGRSGHRGRRSVEAFDEIRSRFKSS